MSRIVKIVLGVLLVAGIAAGSFYGGMVYGQGQTQVAFPGPEGATGLQDWADQGGMPPAGQSGASSGQGGMLSGQILAIGDGELTLKDESGQKIQVYVTDTTLIQKQADVSVTDLQEGETVIVSGSQGADGSITARMVQVSSVGSFGMPGSLPFGGRPGADTGGTTP
jgi:hypothetical protein